MTYELAEATKELDAAIEAAEKALCVKNLGAPASVPLPTSGRLWFRKQGNLGWMLIVEGTDGTTTLLSQVSRPMGVEIARALPALWLALRNARDAHLEEVLEAAQIAHHFADDLLAGVNRR